MGREGWGADCQVRELDGGVRVARGVSLWVGEVVGEDMMEGPRGRRATCGRRLRRSIRGCNGSGNEFAPGEGFRTR